MYMSFYTGAIGAKNSVDRLSVVSNNLANVNNAGFKPKTSVFSELVNYNLNDTEEAVTELQAGAGVKTVRTNTDYSVSSFDMTGNMYDYAITQPNAFFMLQDAGTREITYTRDGQFHKGEMGGRFYLTAENGKLVLDGNRQPIILDGEETAEVGVFTFANPSRLESIGDNEYIPPENMTAVQVENPSLAKGAIERSGTDIGKELINMIESQRAFSYALRMVSTSDEVTQTINNLR